MPWCDNMKKAVPYPTSYYWDTPGRILGPSSGRRGRWRENFRRSLLHRWSEHFSVLSAAGGCRPAQSGLGCPAPARGDEIQAAVRRYDLHIHTANRQLVAGLHHDVVALIAESFVFAEQDARGRLPGLRVIAVVDKVLDGHLLGQLKHTAGVVSVEVRDHQVVDFIDARGAFAAAAMRSASRWL